MSAVQRRRGQARRDRAWRAARFLFCRSVEGIESLALIWPLRLDMISSLIRSARVNAHWNAGPSARAGSPRRRLAAEKQRRKLVGYTEAGREAASLVKKISRSKIFFVSRTTPMRKRVERGVDDIQRARSFSRGQNGTWLRPSDGRERQSAR